uniref:Complex III subunit VI n=1 Tax=Zea mays TaxID=4577 RepID=B6U556_MAIZE|nr:ubiquinol-cytochrome c reductase complex 7.8 kDa protein [Zea mays]
MADAEPVDQKNYLEERCKPQCVKTLYDYEKCVKRVESDGSGQKHCTGQYFDYWSCVDKCVSTTCALNSHESTFFALDHPNRHFFFCIELVLQVAPKLFDKLK